MMGRPFLQRLILALAVAFAPTSVLEAADTWEQELLPKPLVIPSLVHRTGPFAALGDEIASGFSDYIALLNARDGGIGGIPLKLIECETAFSNAAAATCYQQLKAAGGLLFHANSFGTARDLLPIVHLDGLPLITTGYGPGVISDGRVFPNVFTPPVTDWSAMTGILRHIAEQAGGFEQLRGLTIAFVYHNSAYGQAPAPVLRAAAATYGFDVRLLPVTHPGTEQAATWREIADNGSDWVVLWGWGEMASVALQHAANVGFSADRIVGNWWSGSDTELKDMGAMAEGYTTAAFHAPGSGFRAHDEIRALFYENGEGARPADGLGNVFYNRGLLAAVIFTEALRAALVVADGAARTPMPTPTQVRQALETLQIDQQRLSVIGLEGFMAPLTLTCGDHEGNGQILIQQWRTDAERWAVVSEFLDPLHDILAPVLSREVGRLIDRTDIQPRNCPPKPPLADPSKASSD